MSSYVPAYLRRLTIERAEGLCEYCLIHEQDTFLGCQIEHIISEKHGGPTIESNLALACVFCNRAKGTDIATLLPPDGRFSRLFNPRADRWSDHLFIDQTYINPRSDIGAATVLLLAFNDLDRRIERQALIDALRYPSKAARHRME